MTIVQLSFWGQVALAVLHVFLIGAAAAMAEAQTSASANLPDVDISSYPWSSIAKLNNSVGGSCTAVAIEQDKVLTAAHCIFNRRTSRFLGPGSLHVLFGYERGKYTVHALVGDYSIGPGYDPADEFTTASSDWAILHLLEPLPGAVRPLKFAGRLHTVPGSRLMITSYALRRPHILTADTNCEVLGQVPGSALFEHTCHVGQGSSGAPLLLMEGGNAFIVGMQVAMRRQPAPHIMLAISATALSRQQ
jgi:protease YdgD